MIPKIIHYCWFGGAPLPELAEKCIASWKKYCPDYEIKEWNESNFDISCCDYVKEAYQAKKWAFVSDYARFWILYQEGGLYFDTDVEVVKPLDAIVSKGSFMGCETACGPISCSGTGTRLRVAPGLGMGATPGLAVYREILDFYQSKHFLKQNGEPDTTTVVEYTTAILLKHGWSPSDKPQTVANITLYPPQYFCPIDYVTGILTITEATHSIHHYHASWLEPEERIIVRNTQHLVSKYGNRIGSMLAFIASKPYRLKMHLRTKGVGGTAVFAVQKMTKYLFSRITPRENAR